MKNVEPLEEEKEDASASPLAGTFLPALPAARVLGVGLTCVSSHQAELGIVGEGRCDE